MTPELDDYIAAVTANVRALAKLQARIARNTGNEQTAAECERIADDVLDAYNELRGM